MLKGEINMKTYEITILDDHSNIIHTHYYEALSQDDAYENAIRTRKHHHGSEFRVMELDKPITEIDARTRGQKLYHKLWSCMKKAIADEDQFGCHLNEIALHLGRSIESRETYYDTLIDVWCDYFLKE